MANRGQPKKFKTGRDLIDLWQQFCDHIVETDYAIAPTQTEFSKWLATVQNRADRRTIYNSLPIKRLRANSYGQSELECIKSLIDAYDRTLSGLANDIDEHAFIYWLMSGADAMEGDELRRFREIVKMTGVAQAGEGQALTMETKDVPYQARAEQLERLEKNIYSAFGAVDTKALSGSNMVTAQIRAAYAGLDAKADEYEYQLIGFVQDILGLMDIQETPQFKRSGIKNDLEETQRIMLMRDELDDETTLEMLPGIQPEEIPGILRKREEQSQSRYTAMEPQQPQNGLTEPQE